MEEIRYRTDIKYFINMVGMSSEGIGPVTVDGKYALILVHPTNSIAVAPPVCKEHPTFKEIVFYTNCLAYEHDLPAFILPARRKALLKPIEKGKAANINDSYYQSLEMGYEAINSIRLGPLAYVNFRWPGFIEEVDMPYTTKYSCVAKELSLYSTAIRQLDPLSEFLCYFRVIESVTLSNGKDWISRNLVRLKKYDFGFLEFGTDTHLGQIRTKRTNIFSIYRNRASKRIEDLKNKLGGRSIADYFYRENRCGIAHGKTGVKEYDFGFNIEEIAKDVYILKLLSRIAIEDKH
jgi:hypothetical protein